MQNLSEVAKRLIVANGCCCKPGCVRESFLLMCLCADNDHVNPAMFFFFGDWQAGILKPTALASVDTAVNALSAFVRSEFQRDIFSSSNQFLQQGVSCKSSIG